MDEQEASIKSRSIPRRGSSDLEEDYKPIPLPSKPPAKILEEYKTNYEAASNLYLLFLTGRSSERSKDHWNEPFR